MEKAEKNAHIVQLDGLRFYAILMVMIAHWLQWQWGNIIVKSIPFVNGVTLFFVLSGFLITSILLKNRDRYFKGSQKLRHLIRNFYIRRFLRIFPVYYILLSILFIFNFSNTRTLSPWLFSYTINIYQSIHNAYVGDFNHFWSLAVEEQFYLFWPVLILFIKPRKTLLLILIAITLSIVFRIFFYITGHWMATAFFTLSCMHALGLGALLAYVKLYRQNLFDKISKSTYLISSICIYLALLIWQTAFNQLWFHEIFDDFAFAIMSVFLISKASNNGFKKLPKYLLENKFVTYSGKISYGMYLFHLFIPTAFSSVLYYFGYGLPSKYLMFLIFYLITFSLAHLSWKLIEGPFNSLKRKFPYYKPIN